MQKISVIIPLFNTVNYFPVCIESLLTQSYGNIEILIIDDMSNDGSEILAETYAAQNENVFYHRLPERRGPGGARNQGMLLATGELYGFVDSDDWVDSTMYEFLCESFSGGNIDIAVCGVKQEQERHPRSSVRHQFTCSSLIQSNLAFEIFTKNIKIDVNISIPVWNKLYSAEFIRRNKIQFLENSYNEDDYFNFFALLKAEAVATEPRCFYHYRQRNGSIVNTPSTKHIDDLFAAFSKIRSELVGSGEFEKYRNCYISYFLHCFSFLFEKLMSNQLSQTQQQAYLQRMVEKSHNVISLYEFLDKVNISRLGELLV